MFNVKRIRDGEIFQVLDTCVESEYGITYFLIWENDGWRRRLSSNFVPPNYEIKEREVKK